MKRALVLARRGQGWVEPNPMVGCVLVRKGRVISEGYHRRYGGPHAEADALARAVGGVRGSTAYVTLEPCSHFGKTPPCASALIAAGIGRVVAAHPDPFPEVAGRGLAALKAAGIEVQTGLLADEAAELNAPFLTYVVCRRPYVIAKWAQSLDGKIATRTGDSKWITGTQARRLVHQTRARVDAVAVGLGTVIKDDPSLDARDVPRRRTATRVVFDSKLRIPLKAKLVMGAESHPTLILTGRDAGQTSSRKRKQLERRGVSVVTCRTVNGRLSVPDALKKLVALGMTNILVEGGGELLGSFVDGGLVDEAHVYTAPLIIGGRNGHSGCTGEGVSRMADAHRGRVVRRRLLGADELTVVRFTEPPLRG